MDRLNAIRLLQALVAAGANCYAPMADAWIKKVALEIGLRDGKLYSALAYAGTQDWLVDNQKEGSTSLTSGGEAWALPISTTKKIESTTNCSRAMRRGGSVAACRGELSGLTK
jgi:hypothetical protein